MIYKLNGGVLKIQPYSSIGMNPETLIIDTNKLIIVSLHKQYLSDSKRFKRFEKDYIRQYGIKPMALILSIVAIPTKESKSTKTLSFEIMYPVISELEKDYLDLTDIMLNQQKIT